MLLGLKRGITYGPVNSRRLGLSLGINLMPPSVKVCSFDCVYCQYGWTRVHEIGDDRKSSIPSAEDVVKAVEAALMELPSPPAYITFSGHGEPSLHPDFPGIVEAVIETRDRLAPTAKTAILSNSSTVTEERVRRALARLDMRIMKLDCGTEEAFRRYNRPASSITLDGITRGLEDLSRQAPVTIQSLWSDGPGGNLGEFSEGGGFERHQEVTAWMERLRRIKPAFVQVYSLDRDTPAKNLRKLSHDELEVIAASLRGSGIPASAFVR